jgi:hypothetical protein
MYNKALPALAIAGVLTIAAGAILHAIKKRAYTESALAEESVALAQG